MFEKTELTGIFKWIKDNAALLKQLVVDIGLALLAWKLSGTFFGMIVGLFAAFYGLKQFAE